MSEISDAGFLEELVRSLDNALFACLSLARHVGQISDEFDLTDWQVKRAYQVASAVSGGDPDRYVRGFAACTKLLSAALERLAAVKVTAAARLVAGMPRQHWRLYARLWAAAARDGNVVPASEVETFLDDVDRTMFWSTSSAPEVSELRAVRWQSMSIEGRKKIERRLRKGYPAALVSQRLTEQEREEARARRAIAEVERIRAAGGLLSNATERWATRLGEGLPTGPQITSVTQGFKTGARVQSVPLRDRSSSRAAWFEHNLTELQRCDLVFADPDNGIIDDGEHRRRQPAFGKQMPLSEVLAIAANRSAVIYHHNTRFKGGHDKEVDHWLAQLGPSAIAVRANAYSCRTFFIVNPDQELAARAADFCERWAGHKVRLHVSS